MASDDDFECTQVLEDSFEENKSDITTAQVLVTFFLHLFDVLSYCYHIIISWSLQAGCLDIDGESFPIYCGETKIGRNPKLCQIVLDKKVSIILVDQLLSLV